MFVFQAEQQIGNDFTTVVFLENTANSSGRHSFTAPPFEGGEVFRGEGLLTSAGRVVSKMMGCPCKPNLKQNQSVCYPIPAKGYKIFQGV